MPTSSNPTIELVTTNELSRMFRISPAGVYRLVAQRKIPFHKVGGSIRFDKMDILAYLKQNRIEQIGAKNYDGNTTR